MAFSDRHAVVEPLTERQRRTLIAGARVLIAHGSGACRFIQNAQYTMLTDWFIDQLREIVDMNTCIRCGGRARIGEVGEERPCDRCDATGIA